MAATVRLTVLTGPHRGQRYCFRAPTRCLLGRSPECLVRFSGADRDLSVSRRHCLLDVDPPQVRVRDLGSLNGTFVNGRPVPRGPEAGANGAGAHGAGAHGAGAHGAGAHGAAANGAAGNGAAAEPITSGDVVTVGGTSLRIEIVDCPPPIAVEPVWAEAETIKKDCPVACG